MGVQLSGTTIVVTGVASGIGARTAQELRQAGATVIGVDRNPTANANRYVAADLA